MIIDAILDLFAKVEADGSVSGVLGWIAGQLPLDSTDYSGLTAGFGWMHGLGVLFPVPTLLTVFGAMLAIELGTNAFRLALWVFRHVPVVGAG